MLARQYRPVDTQTETSPYEAPQSEGTSNSEQLGRLDAPTTETPIAEGDDVLDALFAGLDAGGDVDVLVRAAGGAARVLGLLEMRLWVGHGTMSLGLLARLCASPGELLDALVASELASWGGSGWEPVDAILARLTAEDVLACRKSHRQDPHLRLVIEMRIPVALREQMLSTASDEPELKSRFLTNPAVYSEAPSDSKLFTGGGPESLDVLQGSLGDCWFLSALSSFAGIDPGAIHDMIQPVGEGTWKVRFFVPSTAGLSPIWVTVDQRMPSYAPGAGVDKPTFVQSKDDTGKAWELWEMLAEKGLAKLRGSYAGLDGDSGATAMELLLGAPATNLDLNGPESQNGPNGVHLDDNAIWQALLDAAASQRPVTVTWLLNPADPENGGHQISVLSATESNGQREVVVRDQAGILGGTDKKPMSFADFLTKFSTLVIGNRLKKP